jgi:hypothetical protein
MNSNFSDVWSDIQCGLHVGDHIKNWSIERGYTGGEFEIVEVRSDAIIIGTNKVKEPRKITRNDFENMYADWPDYCAGKAARSTLRNKSHNLTYILSIFHRQEGR